MDFPDIFQPYEKLIEIEILGTKCSVPENNTILRGFQFLSMESISYGEFCWNGECLNCQVSIRKDGKDKSAIACRTLVQDGMAIVGLSDEIEIEGITAGEPNT